MFFHILFLDETWHICIDVPQKIKEHVNFIKTAEEIVSLEDMKSFQWVTDRGSLGSWEVGFFASPFHCFQNKCSNKEDERQKCKMLRNLSKQSQIVFKQTNNLCLQSLCNYNDSEAEYSYSVASSHVSTISSYRYKSLEFSFQTSILLN
jgi:hypothetical protein